jgi:hypothetical protein
MSASVANRVLRSFVTRGVYQIVYDQAMRTALAALLIAAIGALGWYMYHRPTVARGEVFAEQFLTSMKTLSRVECDDQIPVAVTGARFECELIAKDGDHARVAFKMDRAGRLTSKVISETRPEHRHTTHPADPWE